MITWIKTFWKQLWCRHDWQPMFHSYWCPKCDKIDQEF